MHTPTLSINQRPLLIHQTQILRPHPSKALAVRIDPEVIWIDRVSDSDVSASAFVVVAIQAKPSECGGMMEFAEGALGL